MKINNYMKTFEETIYIKDKFENYLSNELRLVAHRWELVGERSLIEETTLSR